MNFSKRKIKVKFDIDPSKQGWKPLLPETGITTIEIGTLELAPYMICMLVKDD
jgi:hypothetical protein